MKQQKNRAYFDELAAKRAKQRRAKRYYWNDITRYIDFFIREEDRVLEIGCGTGELLNDIRAINKTGIDFSPAMVKEAKEQFPDLDIRLMDAEHIQLNEQVDVIIVSNLVGYLDDVQLVFEQLHKVAHAHTKVIVSYYNFLWEPLLKFAEWLEIKAPTPPQNWLSIPEINNLLSLAGFESYRNARTMLFPLYIPGISWFLNCIVGRLPLIDRLCINHYSFAKKRSVLEQQDGKERFSVSVIVPARNESGNLENLILRLPYMGKKMEIIFVESNSDDDTWKRMNELQLRYQATHDIRCFQLEEAGKNAAVKKGFSEAKNDVLMILDADLTVAPEDLPKFYDVIASGKADFVNGSRLVYPMEKEAMRFLNLVGNKFFSLCFSWLLDQRLKDTLCGTKVLLKSDYQRIRSNSSYFGNFDPFGDFDLLFGAYKSNLSIVELPVRYHERVYGRTNISRFRHGWLLLRMCFFAARKIKFR